VAPFLSMPTRRVPVASLRWCFTGHHHLVAEAGRDLVVAPRAAVRLDRLVRLNVTDVERVVERVVAERHPKRAQSRRTSTTTNAAATSARSLVRFVRERYGLKPTELP
jgi:hypothetical protein